MIDFSQIIPLSNCFSISYNAEKNVSIIVFHTNKLGDFFRLFPGRQLLPLEGYSFCFTDFFLFENWDFNSILPINRDYFNPPSYPAGYDSFSADRYLIDDRGQGDIFLGDEVFEFSNNGKDYTYDYYFNNIDFYCSFNYSDFFGAYNRVKQLTDNKSSVDIYATNQGDYLRILGGQEKKLSIGIKLNSCYDSGKIQSIPIPIESVELFHKIFLEEDSPKMFSRGKILFSQKNNRTILIGDNWGYIPADPAVNIPSIDYSPAEYKFTFNDSAALKTAVEKTAKNTHGLGGKKAQLDICLDFTNDGYFISSFNSLKNRKLAQFIPQPGFNPGYTAIDNDSAPSRSRIYFDAVKLNNVFSQTDPPAGKITLELSENTATFYGENITYQTSYKTTPSVENIDREEYTESLEEETTELKNTLGEYKVKAALYNQRIEQYTIELNSRIDRGLDKKAHKTKKEGFYIGDKKADQLRGKITDYQVKLLGTYNGRKKVWGVNELIEKTEKQIKYNEALLDILNNSVDTDIKTALYLADRGLGVDNIPQPADSADSADPQPLDILAISGEELKYQIIKGEDILLQEVKLLPQPEKAQPAPSRSQPKKQEEKAQPKKAQPIPSPIPAGPQPPAQPRKKREYNRYNPILEALEFDKNLSKLDKLTAVKPVIIPVIEDKKPYISPAVNKTAVYRLAALSLIGAIAAAVIILL